MAWDGRVQGRHQDLPQRPTPTGFNLNPNIEQVGSCSASFPL